MKPPFKPTPHVIVVERDDAVGLLVWAQPGTLLAMLSPHFPIGRSKAFETRHAEAIARCARLDLDFAPGEQWAPRSFEEAVDAIATFDLESGQRRALADLELRQRVYVRDCGAGVVTAIACSGRRIEVTLDEPRGSLCTVTAPRSLVKPVLRPASGQA